MKFSVKVKTGSKKPHVEKMAENSYNVFVSELPYEGKANEAVVKVLADYFGIAKSKIKIISGLKSKQKIIEIL